MVNSKTLTIPEELLGLDNIEIVESLLTSNNEIIIRVKSTKKKSPVTVAVNLAIRMVKARR